MENYAWSTTVLMVVLENTSWPTQLYLSAGSEPR